MEQLNVWKNFLILVIGSLFVFHIEMTQASDNLSAIISMDGSICHDGELKFAITS